MVTTTAKVLACSTDKKPERVETIPIKKTADASRHVVMTLGPGRPAYASMPHLIGDDELQISAELEVTTDHPLPDKTYCVSKPYRYDPKVKADLLLANEPSVTAADGKNAIRIVDLEPETCLQKQHHHLVVFAPAPYRVPAEDLPWNGKCFINVVLSAFHPDAQDDHVLLIGQNEPASAGVPAHAEGDMGKINVVRYRGHPHPSGKVGRATGIRNSHVSINKRPTVIYSRQLVGLSKDEQLLMKAELESHNPHRYPARVSTQVILSDKADGTDLHNGARDYVAFNGEIGKGNGTNCLPQASYKTRKFGTLRVLQDAPIPLFVNVVLTSAAPPPAVRKPDDPVPQPTDAIKIVPGGYLEITRLPPEVTG